MNTKDGFDLNSLNNVRKVRELKFAFNGNSPYTEFHLGDHKYYDKVRKE